MSKNGLTKHDAAIEAGYSESVACKPSNIETPDVKAVFRQMVQSRISAGKLTEHLEAGLGATRMEYFAHKGEVTDQREHVDHRTRAQFIELAAQYGGYVQRDEPVSTHLHMIGMLERDPGPVQSGPPQQPAIDVPSVPMTGQS